MKKVTILLLALASVASMTAAQITGALTIAGGATLNGPINTATQISTWVDPEVESRSGDFTSVAVGTNVVMTQPWVFNPSTPTPAWWSVGGFTFNLASSTIDLQNTNFLIVSGAGTITSAGFDNTPGVWRFTTQSPSAGGVFSFSASTDAVPSGVPDGGTTVALLGLTLAGLAVARRKLSA
jgi:hypothetical protein